MGAKNLFLSRQRHCKNCGKKFRSIRRATCSDECHIELVKQFAAKQDQSRQKQIAGLVAHRNALAPSASPRTVHEAISSVGHDKDFEPQTANATNEFYGTYFGPGSQEKIEILRNRVELGLPLWHPDDAAVCARVSNTGMGVSVGGRQVKLGQARRKKLGE